MFAALPLNSERKALSSTETSFLCAKTRMWQVGKLFLLRALLANFDKNARVPDTVPYFCYK